MREKGHYMNDTQKDETGLSVKTALCLAAITLVGIDGEFKEEELEKLRNLIRSDETAFLQAFNFYNDRPIDVCIKVVSARLNDEQKQVTYRILYDLAHTDQHFDVTEEQLLNKYATAFGLSEDFTASVKTSLKQVYNLDAFN